VTIQIGSPNWVKDLKEVTNPLGSDFWSDFARVGEVELDELGKQIRRKLPDEFREFYRSIGYGSFPFGGGFYSPSDIVACLGAPIYFILGSLTPGREWATEEDHRELWLTRGVMNPAPDKFTDIALTFEGVKLYDLLQFGSDGCCCYHQLYVGPEPTSFRYCLLTDSQTMEDKSLSLSLALERIVSFYLSYLEED
jgi:hypothetical protein